MPIYLMTPLKNWLCSEMKINGAVLNTIDRWRKSGRYGHLQWHTCRRSIFVSGTTMPMNKKPRGKTFHFDWTKADWSKRNREIAPIVGCRQNTVAWARARFAPTTVRTK